MLRFPSTYASNLANTRSKIASRDEIKWEDLLRREYH
jgi:hypothetical protein